MRRFVIVALILMLAPTATFAQKATLTDQEIDAAIAVGTKAKGREMGLDLEDFSAALAAGLAKNGSGTGYVVFMYTPTTWIREQASAAAKEYRKLTRDDITEEMLAPVLRVVIHPSRPTMVTGAASRSSVEHAVLRDEKRVVVIQPTFKEAFADGVSNAMGGRIDLQGVQVQFPLDGVREVRAAGDGEFLLTVVGGFEKDFKIKKKHFDRIP